LYGLLAVLICRSRYRPPFAVFCSISSACDWICDVFVAVCSSQSSNGILAWGTYPEVWIDPSAKLEWNYNYSPPEVKAVSLVQFAQEFSWQLLGLGFGSSRLESSSHLFPVWLELATSICSLGIHLSVAACSRCCR
jgi:hypothetical protein